MKTLEHNFINHFKQLEEYGWILSETDKILHYWKSLGEIIGVENINAKLNEYKTTDSLEVLKSKLLKYKSEFAKKVGIPDSNPDDRGFEEYYKQLKSIMEVAVDNVITQVGKNKKIDQMLLVFEKDINKILSNTSIDNEGGKIKFDTYAGDIYYVGEFFEDIMKILEIDYSRGLLNDKLDTV